MSADTIQLELTDHECEAIDRYRQTLAGIPDTVDSYIRLDDESGVTAAETLAMLHDWYQALDGLDADTQTLSDVQRRSEAMYEVLVLEAQSLRRNYYAVLQVHASRTLRTDFWWLPQSGDAVLTSNSWLDD